MKVFLIPARSSSQRIKSKNIKKFYGKPIIYYPIKSSINSKLFDRIIVSTDSKKIATISKKFGAEAPFLRAKKLSNHKATLFEVIKDSIYQLKLSNKDIICCAFPTSVFLSSNLLKKTYAEFKKNLVRINFLYSITEYEHPIERSIRINRKGFVQKMFKTKYHNRTQDFGKSFHDAALFYWGSVKSFIKYSNVITEKTVGYPITKGITCDIDTPEDWILAEKLFRAKEK